TVTITNYVSGQDVLSFINDGSTMGNITASISGGVLTLSSIDNTATLAQFQSALRAVKYTNTSENPSGTPRDITFVVDDGGSANNISNTIHSTVNVTPVNDAPVLTGTTTITYTENDAATPINTSISLSDVDSTTLASATVTIINYVSGQDVLSFTNDGSTMGNITASISGGVLTLSSSDNTATLAQYQSALRAVKYTNTSENPSGTPRDITFVADDGGSANNISNTIHSTVNVTPVNDAPVLTGTTTITYTKNDAATPVNTSILLSDVDSTTLASATITITNFVSGQDVLSFTNDGSTMGNITASLSGGVLTLSSAGNTATLAEFQSALRAVKYTNTSEIPQEPHVILLLSWTMAVQPT